MAIPRTSLVGTLLVVLLLATPALAGAQEHLRESAIHFQNGGSAGTFRDRIHGDETARYVLHLRSGQKANVQLDAHNASIYFNVTPAGADEALFVGSLSGNETGFTAPASGDYRIDVYLMRNAARRGETGEYALTVSVDATPEEALPEPVQTPDPAPAEPSEEHHHAGFLERYRAATADIPNARQMRRTCMLEAMVRFDADILHIRTLPPQRYLKSEYIVFGDYDKKPSGMGHFRCYFNSDQHFIVIN